MASKKKMAMQIRKLKKELRIEVKHIIKLIESISDRGEQNRLRVKQTAEEQLPAMQREFDGLVNRMDGHDNVARRHNASIKDLEEQQRILGKRFVNEDAGFPEAETGATETPVDPVPDATFDYLPMEDECLATAEAAGEMGTVPKGNATIRAAVEKQQLEPEDEKKARKRKQIEDAENAADATIKAKGYGPMEPCPPPDRSVAAMQKAVVDVQGNPINTEEE